MVVTYPGMTIETSKLDIDSSKALFEGIFATGGITLSQVSIMTGLEPYVIQNWVKRGFVSSPKKRVYSCEQFARIVIINMLRESLQIEKICGLMSIIGGDVNDPDDDLIRSDELYHRYVNMLADIGDKPQDNLSVAKAAEKASADFVEKAPNARAQLVKILQIMLYAHGASKLRRYAEDVLSGLDRKRKVL